jgi:hypothetical protein
LQSFHFFVLIVIHMYSPNSSFFLPLRDETGIIFSAARVLSVRNP